ncbi:MAG TPA: hypothetical protein VJU85_01050 [Nitrososphaeraceae archaeon]|nr:hypothetical protein [Nitrososphaeraceae archaeon]
MDFRQGHGIYLAFFIYFADSILIQYNLLIDRLPFLDPLIGANIIGFAIIFIALYVPIAIIIGYWHRKSQWTVEVEALFKENKVGAVMWLFLIDMVEGKINEKEKREMREMLLKITKEKGKSTT